MTGILREERIGDCRLILGDCLDVLPGLGRGDLVLTDPPYGINRDKGIGGGGLGTNGKARTPKAYAGGWDRKRPPRKAFDLIAAAAPLQIIWGGQFFADMLPARGKWLWWDKCQTMPSYGDGELAGTNLPGDAARKFTYALNAARHRGDTGSHPTQKPVCLMEWCLGFAPAAQAILDPFAGSGTAGVACVKMGRAFIGIERDPVHFQTMCDRIAAAARDPRDMFHVAPVRAVQEDFDL